MIVAIVAVTECGEWMTLVQLHTPQPLVHFLHSFVTLCCCRLKLGGNKSLFSTALVQEF